MVQTMNSDHMAHSTPTVDIELLITRGSEKSLRVVGEPMNREETTLEALHSTSQEMVEWQESLAEKIIESMRSIDPQFNDRCFTPSIGEIDPIDCILDRYRSHLSLIRHYLDISLGYYPTSIHDNWRYFNCVASISAYANQIRSFDPESVRRDTEELDLEDDDRSRFESALTEATQMRAILLTALNAYEKRFDSFVSAVEAIVPGIYTHKSYCCNFIGAYGESELDYIITPGNQCIVARIGQYYDAVLLERLYSQYENRKDVIAYSHRRLGWTTFKMNLDEEADLGIVLKSNFGFGNSSYFMSLLRYKGINAINAPFLIFYSGVRKAEFAGYTYSYRISEESFRPCFENAVELHDEYCKIGEGAFVDKYFRKALSDLSDLLSIVVQTETFLEITTLERFGDLTSGTCNELIPDEGFSQISFELSKKAEDEVGRIAEIMWDSQRNGEADHSEIKMRINRIVRGAANFGKVARLQELVTADLLRNKLIIELSSKTDSATEVKELVDEVAPAELGLYTKTYEGYDLIDVRITKAETVLSFIDRIKEIAEVVRFETILSSMKKSCKAICVQGMAYYSEVIDPELDNALPKRDQALAALKELDVKIDKLQKSNSDITWLKKQRKSTRQTLRELDSTISKLILQKDRILGFEKALKVFA